MPWPWITVCPSCFSGTMVLHPPYKLKRNPHLDIDDNLLEIEHEIIEVQLGLGGPL